MKPLSLQDIRLAVAGKSIGPLSRGLPAVTAVCTDTRQMKPASLFVALRGERFDGHQFLEQAAAGGAIAAIVDEKPAKEIANFHVIVVNDTRVALGKLATFVRKQMRGKIIAVAGSNGKTSTKHLIHAALGKRLRGSISPKSYNNDIGVPLTILPADASQDYLVLEMGTNHPGEIAPLTNMARPDIAVITNCSAEHLEGLGDLAGVRRENATIIEGLSATGLLVVNGDDPELLDAVAGFRGRRLTFGFNPTNDLFAADVRCDGSGVRFKLNGSRQEIFVPLLGRHTAANALAAIAVARRLAVPEAQVYEGLAQASGAEMRLQLQHAGGITLLNDAYNANPASMKAALETLGSISTQGRKIAILGEMRELGESSKLLHEEIGRAAANSSADWLIGVGEATADLLAAARGAGFSEDRMRHFPDSASAAAELKGMVRDGDLVLLKGSRGVHLEKVAQQLGAGRMESSDAAVKEQLPPPNDPPKAS
jgi:UDP-N-acetylmuramoyl-tripeptide--D-alanyl-D-alanine ligase